MAKANVNTASREQLVEAGLRAELADEILKLRRKGKVTGPEALDELPGVGPATRTQLRSLSFGDRAERRRPRPGRRASGAGQRHQGDGRGGGERHDGPGPRPPRRGARRACGRPVPRPRCEREVTHRSAEGTAELGRALMDLVQEQTRHNLETWRRSARRSTGSGWSSSRASSCASAWSGRPELTQRYLEATQAVMTAADAAQDQARKAA